MSQIHLIKRMGCKAQFVKEMKFYGSQSQLKKNYVDHEAQSMK